MVDAQACEVEATVPSFSHVNTECLQYDIKFLFVPHRKHYVSAAKINRETIDVYFEKHMKHSMGGMQSSIC
jgi:hypothetical protein